MNPNNDLSFQLFFYFIIWSGVHGENVARNVTHYRLSWNPFFIFFRFCEGLKENSAYNQEVVLLGIPY